MFQERGKKQTKIPQNQPPKTLIHAENMCIIVYIKSMHNYMQGFEHFGKDIKQLHGCWSSYFKLYLLFFKDLFLITCMSLGGYELEGECPPGPLELEL